MSSSTNRDSTQRDVSVLSGPPTESSLACMNWENEGGACFSTSYAGWCADPPSDSTDGSPPSRDQLGAEPAAKSQFGLARPELPSVMGALVRLLALLADVYTLLA